MSQDPFVGREIDGRYEIQARIGEGGMGVVYKARQISIDRIIALKMLNQQMAQDQTWVQRFYNEAKACSRLQHPNTIRMFDFGQTQDGRLFMTMEFLDGVALRDALQRGPMAPQRVIKVLIQKRDFPITAILRKHLERRLGFVLGRFAERIGRVTVRFSTAHGPLNGDRKRCEIAVGLRPHTVRAEDVDADLFAAVDNASDRLSRSVARAVEREDGAAPAQPSPSSGS